MTTSSFRAVFWDFGGVILSSPFDAFLQYEAKKELPQGFLRKVNATNPDTNAWALLERNEVSPREFNQLFMAESTALGHPVPGSDVLALLAGEIRPAMVQALDTVKAAGYRMACLTNNVVGGDGASPERREAIAAIMSRFDAVVESSKVGCRKPETRFYEIACETLQVSPHECVFLDDLGVNLKPAAAMGMHTIKVIHPDDALVALGTALQLSL
ncbi:MAG: HAD-IA family hydrolase [Ilumatobacteraceae bacterium]|nr:HAD-IA family hydrolase [Ilumatobacteraceae bacterium]